jgi:enoyl-CoA hydratase
MYGMPDELSVSADGPIRIVTINRPDHLNAANATLHRALVDVWRAIRADREAKVVILTGSGTTFCAGADFEWLREMHQDRDAQDTVIQEGTELLLELIHFPLPVIAAVNGAAVGLGCSVAIMCDIVLLSDSAHLADPHVSVGLVAGDGGAAIWPLLGSVIRLKEYLYTGKRILPHEAVSLGLATRVVPGADLESAALTLAHQLAAQPTRALQDTKKTVNLVLAQAAAGAIQAGFAAERECMGSEEHGRALDRLSQAKG